MQFYYFAMRANGLRYLRVGGRGQCLRAGKNSKPEKCLKMPQNPTRQVHALLARFPFCEAYFLRLALLVISMLGSFLQTRVACLCQGCVRIREQATL